MSKCKNCKGKLNRGRKYCSGKCQQIYQRSEKIQNWLAGEFDGIRGKRGELSKIIRDYLLEATQYKCEVCGWSEINKYSNKAPLQIHHIDGNYRNNKPENLQVLCPNCHSLTQTFGSLNEQGKGRRQNGDMI